MKKVFILFSVLASVVFTSCNKDENDGQTPEETLAGSWQLTAQVDNGEASELDNCDKEQTIVFNSDSTYDFVSFDQVEGSDDDCAINEEVSEVGSWSVPSSGLLTITSGGSDLTAEYAVSGDELTLTYEFESEGIMQTFVTVYRKQ